MIKKTLLLFVGISIISCSTGNIEDSTSTIDKIDIAIKQNADSVFLHWTRRHGSLCDVSQLL